MKPIKPTFFKYLPTEDYKAITQVMHQVMKKESATAIATNMGTDYQDMMNRINDNQERAPRKLELVIRVLDESGNPEPFLDWLTERYGYLSVRKPAAELTKKDLLELVAESSKELGEMAAAVLEATLDNKIEPHEVKPVQKEINDLMKIAQTLSLAVEKASKLKLGEP